MSVCKTYTSLGVSGRASNEPIQLTVTVTAIAVLTSKGPNVPQREYNTAWPVYEATQIATTFPKIRNTYISCRSFNSLERWSSQEQHVQYQ